jgi:hypothetical protein
VSGDSSDRQSSSNTSSKVTVCSSSAKKNQYRKKQNKTHRFSFTTMLILTVDLATAIHNPPASPRESGGFIVDLPSKPQIKSKLKLFAPGRTGQENAAPANEAFTLREPTASISRAMSLTTHTAYPQYNPNWLTLGRDVPYLYHSNKFNKWTKPKPVMEQLPVDTALSTQISAGTDRH